MLSILNVSADWMRMSKKRSYFNASFILKKRPNKNVSIILALMFGQVAR